MELITIERTTKGNPALWEEGGGFTNTGRAQVVAGPNGERLKPLYIRRSGPLACGKHALFVVRPGYYVLRAWADGGQVEGIRVYRIVEIGETVAKMELVHRYYRGEWDREPAPELREAVEAVAEKTRCYHCRSPHYFSA